MGPRGPHRRESVPARLPAVETFGGLLQRQLRRVGAILCIGGAAVLAWGAFCTPAGGVVLNARLASSGPPCGAGEACVKQSQVPTTAANFATIDCSVSAHPDKDLWHFTFSHGSFSTDVTQFTAIFSSPSLQIHADSIQGKDQQFAFVYSPAGATLQWAFATETSGDDEFVLSHTCPASQGSSSTTSTATDPTTTVTVTSTSTVTDPVTVTSTSTTTHVVTVTATSTVTDPVTVTSTSTTTVPATVTSTSTTTIPATVTSTSTAIDQTTVTSTATTTVTATSTTTVPATVTHTTAVLANETSSTTPATTGTVAGTSTATESGAVAPLQASNPSSSGGAGGLGAVVNTPNTGAGNRTMAALTGLFLVLAGVSCLGFAPRRTRTAQVER